MGTHIALIVVAGVVAFIGAVGISIGVGKFIKDGGEKWKIKLVWKQLSYY